MLADGRHAGWGVATGTPQAGAIVGALGVNNDKSRTILVQISYNHVQNTKSNRFHLVFDSLNHVMKMNQIFNITCRICIYRDLKIWKPNEINLRLLYIFDGTS